MYNNVIKNKIKKKANNKYIYNFMCTVSFFNDPTAM